MEDMLLRDLANCVCVMSIFAVGTKIRSDDSLFETNWNSRGEEVHFKTTTGNKIS